MGAGRAAKLKNGSMREKESDGEKDKKVGRTRGKESKQEILQSWYHMPGPPFLMRQRSMYSLALSHTGGTPIMPKLTCSNKTPPNPPSPTQQPHPRRPARPPPPAIQCHPFAFPDREPCLISQEFHIDGVRQLSPDREKELGAHPHSALPSPASLQPSVKHTHKQSKEGKHLSQCRLCLVVLTEGGTNAYLVWICAFICAS